MSLQMVKYGYHKTYYRDTQYNQEIITMHTEDI